MINVDFAQSNMIKQQLRTGNVLNNTILNLYQTLPRDTFVPRIYKQFAYSDYQIPLNHQQKMLTPLEESSLLQALNLQGTELVLEIGTGCGYLTALLAQCSKEVISVDYYDDFTRQAKENLAKFNINNVTLHTGDAHRGWMTDAPYDVIVITGAIKTLGDVFKTQIMKTGKIFAITGTFPAMRGSLFTLDEEEQWVEKILFDTCVEPLITPVTDTLFDFFNN